MFFVLPYHVDVPMRRLPWMNWVLIGVTVLFFPLCVQRDGFTSLGEELVLGGPSVLGVPGHILVHADLLHLLGNMLFLWVFGNAVCAKVGNLAYPFIYFGLGMASGLIAQAVDPRPAVGASGAINGIVGMFVVWYLLNNITCWCGGGETLEISSYWVVLLFACYDVWGMIKGGGNVGYLAHLSGFALGFTLAIVLLLTGVVKMKRGERSLLQVLSGEEEEPRRKRARPRL
jgi:membrane associated rhomboid family serine protease